MLEYIEGNHPEKPLALSIQKTFLQRVQESLQSGQELKQSDFGNPYPDLVTPEMLEVLPGISMLETEEDVVASAIGDILLNLWQLSEARQRLSQEESTEGNWLRELEEDYKRELTTSLTKLKIEAPKALSRKYEAIVEEIIVNDEPFTSQSFQQLFVKDIQARVVNSS